MAGPPLLHGLRALDLTDERGSVCGRILADLGADVIKVEPPGGSRERRVGPFWDDDPRPENSLWFLAYNAGKRGVTLDVGTQAGRRILTRLAEDAAFLVESAPAGAFDGLGLEYEALRAVNPALVYGGVTDFGGEGPYSGYLGSDLITLAMGGLMNTQGDAGRPPVGFSLGQGYLHAGAEAAAGMLIAHYQREVSGEGRRVEVSAQEAVTWGLMNAAQIWDLNRTNTVRGGAVRPRTDGVMYRMHWPTKDGYVTFFPRGDWAGLSAWMLDEEFSDDPGLLRDWTGVSTLTMTQEELDHYEGLAQEFFATKTASELYEGAVKWRFNLYPVLTTEQLIRYAQLREREFWVEVEHDERGAALTYPGSFAQTSNAPPLVRGRAPLIGEHNDDVYRGELGLSRAELGVLRAEGAI